MTYILLTLIFLLLTIFAYQAIAKLQLKLNAIWLNPMLFSILLIILVLSIFHVDYITYYQSTKWLNDLLEPAIVALGYPLYQHLNAIKKQWKIIVLSLTTGAIVVISVSFLLTIYMTENYALSISLALKSITTPIALALTQQLNGNQAITAFAIIVAGLVGAIIGMKWLSLFNVHSVRAQGLAIGAASHALGTATLSQISHEHTAYSSIALIYSAIITALVAPTIIELLNLANIY